MNKTQTFRVVETLDTVKLALESVDGQSVVYWDDIEQVFPGVKYVKNGDVVAAMTKDSKGIRMLPHRIKHYPGAVLDVILTASPSPDPSIKVRNEVSAYGKSGVSPKMTAVVERISMLDKVDETGTQIILDALPQATELHSMQMHNAEVTGKQIRQMEVKGIRRVRQRNIWCLFAGCNKSTAGLRDMARHISDCHSNVRRFSCTHCAKSYSRADGLKTHQKNKHPSG